MKPIIFNTDMVRAILEGRKTVTRRVVKPQPQKNEANPHRIRGGSWFFDVPSTRFPGTLDTSVGPYWPPCQPGDIIYVRETWTTVPGGSYVYRGSVECPDAWRGTWRPSIHMPKNAARLFLRVRSVRVERLREMVLGDVLMEGIQEGETYEETWGHWHRTWDSTTKPADRPIYGWEANPWVWVISFERINREEALK